MKNPLTSKIIEEHAAIVIAMYNGGKYIRAQIDLIIHQTYVHWKLYIRDDGSKDNTVAILKSIARKMVILC